MEIVGGVGEDAFRLMPATSHIIRDGPNWNPVARVSFAVACGLRLTALIGGGKIAAGNLKRDETEKAYHEKEMCAAIRLASKI